MFVLILCVIFCTGASLETILSGDTIANEDYSSNDIFSYLDGAHGIRFDFSKSISSAFGIEFFYANNKMEVFKINKNKNIFKLFVPVCAHFAFPKDLCYDYMTGMNEYVHNSGYISTLENSKSEDWKAQRSDVIKYFRERFPHYNSYLEIGCDTDTNFNLTRSWFHHAVGVDPANGGTLRMTSDDFFR